MDYLTNIALRGYQNTRSSFGTEGAEKSAVASAAKSFEQVLSSSEQHSQMAISGKSDPHVMVEAIANSQLAVETAVTVRDKVVEAYQEILRMPV